MGDKNWKRFERDVAKLMGTVRIGPTGQGGPDLVNDQFSVQCKWRTKLPEWLNDAFHSTRVGIGEGLVGIVVMKEKGKRTKDSMVLIRLEDFLDLTNGDA